ncbi:MULTISPECIES: hypothetical protein [unclassified Methylobacterium]|uniref:hypothetical protein n=1 Tax=unclassified Methylobacterium TaxID=2615210 RepID=UPI0006FBC44F|nr:MULTISPECIES: hypothetical protein [unclassified Methylobacterium]KQO71150.1 hypothetical protein ASF18_01295 [Methylobacterium sp. Leaf89]KQO79335.1 hypothetical protein ASF20_01050 [Methylobacterium sp. Leaf88]
MSFTVSARVLERCFSFRHSSVLGAVEQGWSLMIAGMTEVRITDASGRVHCPNALHQHLFGPRETARPDTDVIALAA